MIAMLEVELSATVWSPEVIKTSLRPKYQYLEN